MTRIEAAGGGWVSRREPGSPGAVASGPRLAVLDNGEVVCTFMVQPALGVAGFVPLLTRSRDGGVSWDEPVAVWPERHAESIFCSLSRDDSGDLLLFGTSTTIATPGEPFWSAETQGMKENALVWARSADGGRAWTSPRSIPMPFPGAAEAAGPLCATRSGRLVACYAPYPTFDRSVVVERNRVASVTSDDGGASWRGGTMLAFPGRDSGAAEAWVVELSDGRLAGVAWHMSVVDGTDHPNAYALSGDSGRTWSATRSTGLNGQSASLTALPGGRVACAYNQRRIPPAGVRIAIASPSDHGFGIEADELAWAADAAVSGDGPVGHDGWTAFAFGEPASCVLPGGRELLVVLWCVQPDGQGIRWVRVVVHDS